MGKAKNNIVKLMFLLSIGVIFLACSTFSQADTIYDESNGCVSYWKMDDNADTTVVVDEKGDAPGDNPGTFNDAANPFTNAHDVTGRVGGALEFDGSDDYVNILSIDDSIDDSQSGTITAWINSKAAGTKGLFAYSSNTVGEGYIWFSARSGGLEYIYRKSSGAWGDNYIQLQTSTGIYPYNEWAHVAVTSDGSSIKMYINGIQKSITTQNGNNLGQWFGDWYDPDGIMLGTKYYNQGNTNPFTGSIDEVAVWNTALSANQIDALYKTGVILDVVNDVLDWNLGYTTDEINQLAYLYYQETGSIDIGGDTWNYIAHGDPVWDAPGGTRTVGGTFTAGGVDYLYLGGGVALGGSGVPELPSGVIQMMVLLFGGGFGFLRRKINE